MRYILASKSPRRRELLGKILPGFEIIACEVDETLPAMVSPHEGAELLAVRKGAALLPDYSDALIISSDTLVELDGTPLGKPCDENEARRMLRALSGRAHSVHTGVAVHFLGKCFSGCAVSRVYFRELTDSEINAYIKTGEPMDKAGAYGIQGLGGALVSHYEGDFDTIVGLSLALTKRLISEALGND